jgi:hypothetical protein
LAIAKLAGLNAKLAGLNCPSDFVVVMDLHSNSTYRFKQFGGTPALPVKDGKKYHFPGDIVLTDDTVFQKITASLAPVLLSAQDRSPPYRGTFLAGAVAMWHTAQTLMNLI